MPDFLGTRVIRGRSSALLARTLKQRQASSVERRAETYHGIFLAARSSSLTTVSRGFTLIELVVVTAIIALITGLILVSDSTFGGKILLENLAYDMALSIRQAQIYGISTQRFTQGSFNTFNTGYGVHFDMSDPTHYLTFADACTASAGTPPDGLYTVAGSSCVGESVGLTTIDRGFKIVKLCATKGGTEHCDKDTLDIVFVRPEPDAIISYDSKSCPQNQAKCQNRARIQIVSPRGDTDSIVIEKNGQISVQRP
jgi:prepilin-type N-terminal cleavage/methylation domain-containing protein